MPTGRAGTAEWQHPANQRRIRPWASAAGRTVTPFSAVTVEEHAMQQQLGKDWPFRDITSGYVGCDAAHPGAIVFTPSDGAPGIQGEPFAINGTALDAGYKDVPKSIWLPEPQYGSDARKSITPIHHLAPNGCRPSS